MAMSHSPKLHHLSAPEADRPQTRGLLSLVASSRAISSGDHDVGKKFKFCRVFGQVQPQADITAHIIHRSPLQEVCQTLHYFAARNQKTSPSFHMGPSTQSHAGATRPPSVEIQPLCKGYIESVRPNPDCTPRASQIHLLEHHRGRSLGASLTNTCKG